MRELSSIDQFIGQADAALKSVAGGMATSHRPSPALAADSDTTDPETSARLMRVNHCGEVCAQALYQGQALTSSNPVVTESLQQAAQEEEDHLAWCEARLNELDSHTSYLNPLWYAGSFAMGATAGLLGDKINLGFVNAVEEEVCKHIDDHLEKLPSDDLRSRAILEKMREDEARHASSAIEAGGTRFPSSIRQAMTFVSRAMTRSTYWV